MISEQVHSGPPRLSNRPGKRLKISMTPLIDVVFILLVFFMLASNFEIWQSIRLTSTGNAGVASDAEGALLLDVTPDGPRLSGRLLNMDELALELHDRLQKKPDQHVLLKPSPGIDMQKMISLIDLLALSGVREVALMPGIQN